MEWLAYVLTFFIVFAKTSENFFGSPSFCGLQIYDGTKAPLVKADTGVMATMAARIVSGSCMVTDMAVVQTSVGICNWKVKTGFT